MAEMHTLLFLHSIVEGGTSPMNAKLLSVSLQHFTGKARGFTWNTIISRLIGAFNDLKFNGDPRSDANKVDVLLKKTVGDSSLSNGRSHMTGDAVLRSNFQGAIDYLTAQVLAAGNNNTQRHNQQLAAFTQGGGGGRGGDGRSGSRGRGNGASNRLQSNVPDCFSRNGILLNDGGYSNQIWREEFTQEERNICLEMRRNRRNGGGGRGGRGREGRGGRGRGRGISAVHDGRTDQEETKEEDNTDGHGAGVGMSRHRRNNGGRD
ncbi:unnamed protein product [Cylindrotheca closterium]|uniref:Uncharacterized protein n=1 Tax=Cylindrotheca closterium TaxID=2856 RepID=A0AAD2G9H7_9STRA|nr:unnamed protein product [Cylindrotheca closterium]